MEKTTSYQYKANSEESYNSLAAYAVTVPATVTYFPVIKTIVVSGDDNKEIGRFIDAEGLDFEISPISVEEEEVEKLLEDAAMDAPSLRKVIELLLAEKQATAARHENEVADLKLEIEGLKADNETIKKDRDSFKKWGYDKLDEVCDLEKRVKTVLSMMQLLFPDTK